MRVLFWSECFWPYIGGAEIFACKLIHSLQVRGHQFVVVTRKVAPEIPVKESYRGIQIRRFPFWAEPTDRTAAEHISVVRRQVKQLERTFNPDLVHIHGFSPSSVLFHFATTRENSAPRLLTLTNELRVSANGCDSLKLVLRSCDWITGKAITILTQARQFMPGIVPRSSLIYNGLESLPLHPQPLPFQHPRLLCLGRIVHQKGFDVALDAFSRFAKHFPGIRMVIAGDGPDRPRLEQRAGALGLANAVEFLGWVAPEKVPALIDTATIVLMPSRWEGLPSVALQASMMARPIVATPVGGLGEVVLHRETGLLVAPDNPAELADAITSVLNNPAQAVEMGKTGRRRVLDVFGWQHCVDAYDELYRKLLHETQPRVPIA